MALCPLLENSVPEHIDGALPIVGEVGPLEHVDGTSSGALPIVGELGPLEHVDGSTSSSALPIVWRTQSP